MDEDSVFYLMTRGLIVESIKLLVSGFLKEILETVKIKKSKIFCKEKMEFFYMKIENIKSEFQYLNKKLMVNN